MEKAAGGKGGAGTGTGTGTGAAAGAGVGSDRGKGEDDKEGHEERGRREERREHKHHHKHKRRSESGSKDTDPNKKDTDAKEEHGHRHGHGHNTDTTAASTDARGRRRSRSKTRRSSSRSGSRPHRSRSSSRGSKRSTSRGSESSRASSQDSKASKTTNTTNASKQKSPKDGKSTTKKHHHRKKHGGKGKSVKDRPSDWTREEIMEKVKKLANFQLNKVTGMGIFECVNKRLLPDDVELYYEVMRRYNEVQVVAFKKCLISDEGFTQLVEGMRLLRHLKFLNLTNNLLTKATVGLIITHFGTAARRLESIDLRLNNLTEEDGILLYRTFSSIAFINGIPISGTRTNLGSRTLSLTDQNLKQCEMGILSCLLGECRQISTIDLSKNQIDSKGLTFLMGAISNYNQINAINLSNNPLTYPEIPSPSMSGLRAIVTACKNHKHICEVNLDGVKHVPEHLMAQIITSTQVNRSLQPVLGNRFEMFAERQLIKTAPPARVMPTIEFVGGFDIDFVFCRLNNIPETSVKIEGDEFFLTKKKIYKNRREEV
jgi:hypothetical protein